MSAITISTIISTTPLLSSTTMASWYTLVAAEEARTRARIFCLSPAAWRAEATRMIRTARQGAMQATIAFIQSMDEFRASPPLPPAAPRMSEPRTADDVDWSLWQDMVEDPAKYGDDIIQWLELDESLRAGPKRWRVDAFWLHKEQEKEAALEKERAEQEALQIPYKILYSRVAKQAAVKGMKMWLDRDIKNFLARIRNAATTIQAAVRGHLVRSSSPFLDCCMCLAHTVCPLQTDHGMMCRNCAEQGPHEDTIGVSDPWNWSRGDYVDLAPTNGQLTAHERSLEAANHSAMLWVQNNVPQCEEEEDEERCSGCGTWYPAGEMDSCGGYGKYCSRECGPSGYARDFGYD